MSSRRWWPIGVVAGALVLGLAWSPFTPAVEAADLARGKKIYKIMCAKCHGKTGRGDGSKAKELEKKPADYTRAGFFDELSDAKLEQVIRQGESPMPAFGDRLRDKDVKNVIAYIKTFAGGGSN